MRVRERKTAYDSTVRIETTKGREIYFHLFIIKIPKSRHRMVGAHQSQGKKKGKTSEMSEEKERAQRGKHPTRSLAMDALIRDE